MDVMRKTLLPILFLILVGCSEESVRLDKEDLTELLNADRNANFASLRFEGHVSLKMDKTAFLSIPALGNDTGTWWIEGNRLCSKWKQAIRGKTACAYISKRLDGSYVGHDPNTGFQVGTFELTN